MRININILAVLVCGLLGGILLNGCSLKNKVEVISFEESRMTGLNKGEFTFLVRNDSRHNITIESERYDVYRSGGKIGQLIPDTPVVVPKKYTGPVTINVRARITDPLALLSFDVTDQRQWLDCSLDGSSVVKIGPVRKKFDLEMTPVRKIINKFGASRHMEL